MLTNEQEYQAERIDQMMESLREDIEIHLPKMRETSLAITKLQEASMWLREVQFAPNDQE